MIIAGQGPIYMGTLNTTTGKLEDMVKIGCGNRNLNLALTRETREIKESCTGQRLTIAEFETAKSMEITLEMADFDADMLNIALYGTKTAVAGSTVVEEEMPTMAVSEYYHTRYPDISSVVVKDSAGSPATLVLDTDYSIDSATFGRIKILSLGAYTQPFTVDYTYAASTSIKQFSDTTYPSRALIFDGTSLADGSTVRVTLPSIRFSPTSGLALLGEEETVLTLTGKALYDDVFDSDALLGSFGRFEVIT